MQVPVKKLIKTGLIAPPGISLLILLILLAKGENYLAMVTVPGVILGTLYALWFSNLGILVFLNSKEKPVRRYRIIRYGLSYLSGSLIYLSVYFLINYLHGMGVFPLERLERSDERHLLLVFMVQNLLINTIVLVFQNFIILQDARTRTELENVRLKAANTEAANQLLKQQIQPHFLFNALNTLKSLIRKYPGMAEDYLIRLSDFLRASISFHNTGVVRLEDELKLCLDYLEMQKIQLGEALQFTVCIPEEKQRSDYVPAFSLQPLLENAIKHNVLTPETPLQINIKYEAGSIVISNNVQQRQNTTPSTGLGLTNLAERYKILSGDDITIQADEELFSVSIPILHHADSNHRG